MKAPLLLSANLAKLNDEIIEIVGNAEVIAVNQDPASPAFGRIYVSNARTEPTGSGRPMEDGIALLNAIQDVYLEREVTIA